MKENLIPDETDWKIINLLRENYNTNSAIAQQLGVSEGMVRQRIKRLREADILTIKALINPDALDVQQLAMIGVSIQETSLLEEKANELSQLPGVLSVSITTGRYDLFLEVLVNSNHGLVDFLTNGLSRVNGISKSETFLMLKNYNRFV